MDSNHVAAGIRKKEGRVDQEDVFRDLIRALMANGTKCSLEEPSGTREVLSLVQMASRISNL